MDRNSCSNDRILSHALRQIDRTIQRTRGAFPHHTEKGRWITTADGSWTGGLWVGQLWLAYELTGQAAYRDYALELMQVLAGRIDSPATDFDLGFLFYPSFVDGYRLTGDSWLRTTALQAAERLVSFFHTGSGLIYTVYTDRAERYGRCVGSSIVDIMMNLSLLWWAGHETGEPRYHTIAREHANRTAELFVRPDGSAFHVVDFDMDTGEVLHRGTIHGYSDDSTWARGQAWALHGYLLAYRITGESLYLDVGQRLSEHFLNRLPNDGIPYWDMADPGIPNATRDSSAGAIAAAAWLRLEETLFYQAGQEMMRAMAEHCLPRESDDILGHATAYKMQGRGVDGATVWGDYYFLAACVRNDRCTA